MPDPRRMSLAADVRAGLDRRGQKELPSKYLYDDVGSALFEAITLLPEYGLARAGERLLRKHAREIIEWIESPAVVAELGCGSGSKTRWILQALGQRQPVTYHPIEISASALARCELELGQLDAVSVVGFEKEYLDGLAEVADRRLSGQHLLVLFLGSTIGNFDRPAGDRFLQRIRSVLIPGDALLLATDLENSVERQLLAYDDPAGVTAAFNLNLLARINRELDASFDLARFRHHVRWDRDARRIEMHLRSTREQAVAIPGAELEVSFREGETIWTESCHKYAANEITGMASRAGYRLAAQWIDSEWPFAQNLLRAE
jgi:dimethylhistidine N-methyltransferase